jgi:hypothetical protein
MKFERGAPNRVPSAPLAPPSHKKTELKKLRIDLLTIIVLQEEFGEKLIIPYLVGREHTGTYSCIVDTSADRIVLVTVK